MLLKLICNLVLLYVCQAQDLTFRIWGGKPVSIDQVPYQISLQHRGEHWCGGTILSNDAILTAAHCIAAARNKTISDMTIRAGSTSKSVGGSVVGIREMVIPPDYNTPIFRDYDIGILWLKEKLVYDKNIQPIPELPKQDEPIAMGTKAFVAGWGITENGTYPEMLRGVEVTVWDQTKCKDAYSPLPFYTITPRIFCAGDPGKDACVRDSGSGLVAKGKLIGVVSFGPTRCGHALVPGAYANVGSMRSWIDDNLSNPPPNN